MAPTPWGCMNHMRLSGPTMMFVGKLSAAFVYVVALPFASMRTICESRHPYIGLSAHHSAPSGPSTADWTPSSAGKFTAISVAEPLALTCAIDIGEDRATVGPSINQSDPSVAGTIITA